MIQYLCTIGTWNDCWLICLFLRQGRGFKCSFLIPIQTGIIRHVQHTLTLLPVGARGNTPSDKVKPKQAEHAMIALPDFKRMRVVYQ